MADSLDFLVDDNLYRLQILQHDRPVQQDVFLHFLRFNLEDNENPYSADREAWIVSQDELNSSFSNALQYADMLQQDAIDYEARLMESQPH